MITRRYRKAGLLLPWLLVASVAAWWTGSFARELTGEPASACHVLRAHTLRPAAPRPSVDPVAPCALPGLPQGPLAEHVVEAAEPRAAELGSPASRAARHSAYPRGPPAGA